MPGHTVLTPVLPVLPLITETQAIVAAVPTKIETLIIIIPAILTPAKVPVVTVPMVEAPRLERVVVPEL